MSHAKNDTFDASSVQLPAGSKLRGLMIFGFIIGVIGTGVTIMREEHSPALAEVGACTPACLSLVGRFLIAK